MQDGAVQVCAEIDIDVTALASIGEDVRIKRSSQGLFTVAWKVGGICRVVASTTITDAAFLALACADALQNRAACEEVARG